MGNSLSGAIASGEKDEGNIMLQSKLFPKTRRQPPRDAESVNHKLLVQGGFIDQLMAGSWTLLPLGWRVISKINRIIREEINAIGGQEVLLPLLHPKSIWNETERWEKAEAIMYKLADQRGKEFALSFTHEEIVMDILRKNIRSFKDLPVALYQFSTKFRNEPRARSGILRGREFLMKDLYSAHGSEEDLMGYYEAVKDAYALIFQRLGLSFRITEAGGGVFTDRNTHEFQVISRGGEDRIFYCDNCEWGINKEIFSGSQGEKCPNCRTGKIVEANSIEVGNIFPLGTWYAEKMKVAFTDKDGKQKPVWFGSYGIGPTRVLGALVEVSHDDRGIIWFPQVAPFTAHLIQLPGAGDANGLYHELQKAGIEVLWDDRDVPAGEKFIDADLVGIPVRLVVSEKTGGKVEWKRRESARITLVERSVAIDRLKKFG